MSFRKLSAALACAAALFQPAARAQLSPLPPTPSVRLAVDPVLNKVYAANKDANSITALDASTGTSTPILVGNGPDFIAVDPTRNRVYVNNTRDASLTVLNGAANAVIATHDIGSMGPIAMNPDPTNPRNVVYIVRMTSAASDEVTYFFPATPTWYSIATDSFQPGALAVNPATHTIFVTHYATGDLRIIDGAFTGNDFPHPPTRGMWSKPFAVVANPATNKAYVVTEDSRGPIGVVNGATLDVLFPAVTAGHATGPRSIVVNPVTNKVYAAFAGEVIVIDGATNALTYIPIAGAGSGGIALGVNYSTNRIYAATELGTLSVIDGATNTVESSQSIAPGTSSIGINPVTNTVYLYSGSITALAGAAGTAQSIPLTTTITPFPGNSSSPSNTVTLQASSGWGLPVRKVYYRIDSTTGPWTEAADAGAGTFTASFSSLSQGSHTLYAFAVDDQVAPLSTGPQSNPLVGQIASYAFTVTGSLATPSVSLASSSNPSFAGNAVTFTASVTGSAGTPTGTVTFLDGTNALCSAVALASGSAACTSASLSAGAHSITAQYSGDSSYLAASSAALSQTVNTKLTATLTLASSLNPSGTGQSVTFTLTASGSGGTPTGTVTFKDGATSLCANVSLSTGGASCTTSALTAGSHSIRADYAGNATYNAGSSNVVTQSVQGNPTVALASSANPSTQGQAVTFTASVGGSDGTPTGTITFTDGTATLCAAVALSGNTATCGSGSLAAGNHAITAQYSGDAKYKPASAGITQGVNAPPPPPPPPPEKSNPTVAVSTSANPAAAGSVVTFTAMVSGAAGAGTGSVDFIVDGAAFGGCTGIALAAGGASCSTSALASGTHSIAVQYSGDGLYNAGSSAILSQAVSAPPPSAFMLTVSVNGAGNVVSSPSGIDCGADCSETYAAGATVTLTATPAAGAVFLGWSGDCAGTAPCRVTMNAARSVTATFRAPTGELVARYRLYNPSTAEHLYTTDLNEYQVLAQCCGWLQEGAIYRVFRAGGNWAGVESVPNYRLYNPNSFQHHWTTDANEYNVLATLGWIREGIDGYILPAPAAGALPLYRLYLNAYGGLHLWTTDANERDVLTAQHGWVYEGIGGYVIPLT